MADPFLGEIRIFPYDFAPSGWERCQGQLQAIPQNVALYSLLGTTYGGNGTSVFALPDLGGAVVVGAGQGPDGREHAPGEVLTEWAAAPGEPPSREGALRCLALTYAIATHDAIFPPRP